ncbi:glyoxalase [uncultured archaeon]|nr:glyoxalase [uncultured archaeon]
MSFDYYGIDHVQLAALEGSEGVARDFFHGVLGMKEIEKPENLKKRGGLWFKCGTNQIHIGIDHDFRPAKKAHPAIHVKNLNVLKERIVAKGISVKEDEPLPGDDRFYVDDPFGNRMKFLEWK